MIGQRYAKIACVVHLILRRLFFEKAPKWALTAAAAESDIQTTPFEVIFGIMQRPTGLNPQQVEQKVRSVQRERQHMVAQVDAELEAVMARMQAKKNWSRLEEVKQEEEVQRAAEEAARKEAERVAAQQAEERQRREFAAKKRAEHEAEKRAKEQAMQKEWAAKDAALAKQLEELVEQVESGQAPPEAAAMLNNLLGGLLGSPPATKAPTMAPSPVAKPRSPSKPTLRGVAPMMPPPQQQQPSSPSARMQQQPSPSARQHDQQQQQQQSPTASPTARTQTARRVAMKPVEADEEHIATGAEGGLAEAEAALDEIEHQYREAERRMQELRGVGGPQLKEAVAEYNRLKPKFRELQMAVRRAARLSDAGRSSHVPVIGSKASMLSARRLDRQRERLAARGGGMVF